MSVKKPKCECCGRVRKKAVVVTQCERCRKNVCAQARCRLPHDAATCGDALRNFSERRRLGGEVECSRSAL